MKSIMLEGRQTLVDMSVNTELQCGHVKLLEEVEEDADGVSCEPSTPEAIRAAFAGLGASSAPIGLAFLRAMMSEYE